VSLRCRVAQHVAETQHRITLLFRNSLFFSIPDMALILLNIDIVKIALAHSDGFIAPRVDLASEILVVELNADGTEVHREALSMQAFPHPLALVNRLKADGVDTLICGAISGFLERVFVFNGIRVISWVTASVEEAIQLIVKGELSDGYLAKEMIPSLQRPLPRGWRHRRRHRFGQRRRK